MNNDGDTPLHLASRSGLDPLITLFIQFNANLNLYNRFFFLSFIIIYLFSSI